MRTPYDPAPRRPPTSGEHLGALVFALLLLGLMAAELVDGMDPRKLSVLFILLSWYPLIAIHELGHALVARAVGWRVHEIVLGYGPVLFSGPLLGTRMVVRLIPAGGYVVPSPSDLEHARRKSALIYLAGPAAELLIVGCAYLAVGPSLTAATTSLPLLALQSLCVAALMGAVMNLIPTRTAGGASDGLGFLLSFGTPKAHFRYRMVRPTLAAAEVQLFDGAPEAALARLDEALERDPECPHLLAMRARCLAAAGQLEPAFSLLETLREHPDGTDLAEAERLHAAAHVALMGGDRSLLGDAEQACRAALERMPGGPDIQITHGEILLENGRIAAAGQALQAAYNRCREPHLERRCLELLARVAEDEGRASDAARLRAAMGPRQ